MTNPAGGSKDVAAARALAADGDRTAAAYRLLRAGHTEASLQSLTVLATQLLGVQSAEISLLTDERVIVAAVDAVPGPAGTRTALESSLCARVAAAGERLVVHDAAHDTRVAGAAGLASGQIGAYLGVPLLSDDRRVVGAMCAYDPQVRAWSEHDAHTLEHLAAAAVAQLEITALHAEFAAADRGELLAAATQAAGIGTFQWDLRTGALRWDAALLEVFGYDEESFGGTIRAFNARVHPDDLTQVTAALNAAIAACGVYEAEFRVQRPDGAVRWLVARGQALPGPYGTAQEIIGVTTDVTALREGEQRVHQVLEDMTVAYFHLDEVWRFTYVNAEAERVLGSTRDRLIGGDLWELFPAAVGTVFEESYRAVAQTGEPVVFDAYYPAPLDAWYEVRAVPERGGVAAYFTDITDRHRALAVAERARARSALLADVATNLAEVLDPTAALEAVLPHLVPQLGDFAIVSLLEEGHGPWRQRLRDVAALHADPALQAVLENYLRARLPALSETSPIARALTSGRPITLTSPSEHAGIVGPGPARELLDQLAPHASLALPLRGRGHTRGLLTLYRGTGRGAFTDGELTTMREVVAQVGLALDNAHLHATRRHLAEELQRSLLTALPEPDHLHLAARYVPAATGAQIGGDWYDAFVVRDGSTCLVIGDVAGHDLRAAVTMAQVRNVLRGGAHAVVQPPAHILSSLDWAMHDLAVGSFSTAILAKIEQTPEQAEAGLRMLRWSNAGHLPPVLLHPDGHAELLERPADLLLGIRAHTQRHDHTHELPPESTVLLYTDGLVERRGEPLRHGLERLRQHIESLADLPLDDLCDRLIQDLAANTEDDVALLAVRAHREDRARPASAGPRRTSREAAQQEQL
ncbi:SpoIIE family protein phosphatase [Cellulomonas sp. 179-A 4D5 NHS]|uniref:SpoIIE family protein phosphatase n=1 Tax=Cellulomonas sp. 179-A 4D5 NHS TaxID=3142378 RepID=UPI00399F90C6